jgi:hypothetical protein
MGMDSVLKRNGMLRRDRVVGIRLSKAAGRELDAICLEQRRTPGDLVAQVVNDWLTQHAVARGYRSEAGT